MVIMGRSLARDPYDEAIARQLAARAPGGFAFFIGCLLLSSFFEMMRFEYRRFWMAVFAAGLLALVGVCWTIVRVRPRSALWVMLAFVNVTGIALNAYHVIVAAPVAMCLWTLTGLLGSAPVVLGWGASEQAMAALGAVLSYPVHWAMGTVDAWTWAAGASYLLVVVAMSVFGAALYERYQRRGLELSAALSEREARLQSYFDLALVGTTILTSDGRLREVNDELCRLLDCERADLLEQTWPPFGASIDRAVEAAHVATALAGDRAATVRELRLRRRDGSVIDASVGMRGLPGPGDVIDHVMVVVQDVTVRRRVEAERELVLARELAARAEAEAASRAKDAFLAALSHELRTPLTPILSWAKLLRSGGLAPDETVRAVEAIERNARAQRQLVEDLLDVSRIATGKLRIRFDPVDLDVVIADAVDVIRPAAHARRVELAVNSPACAPCTIEADPDRLRQVFWNLLSNAVKFTSSGGRVVVTTACRDGVVRVTVADTGSGIAPEFLPHVFERFRQGEIGAARKHGGLGIGLAIVRELVELHGGTVRAESEGEGKGATFTIELPLPAQPVALERPAPEPVSASPLRGVRILLVDDDRDSMEVVRFLLSRSGADVDSAMSARQALDLLAQSHPDVLVSDIAMPGTNGYALLARIRAGEGGRPDMPAIALTAYSAPEDRERALSGGFQAHVSKPVEIAELVAAVQSVRRATTA
jgi:PAS domain S-box-containing protein